MILSQEIPWYRGRVLNPLHLLLNLDPYHSEEHGAKHDATSGMKQLPARSERQSRERHQDMDLEEKQGHVASEAKRKEHGAPSPECDQLPGGAHAAGGEAPPSSVR